MAYSASSSTAAIPRAQFHNKFLLKVANLGLQEQDQFQLGVLLDIEPSAIRAIIRESQEAETMTFTILETWRNQAKVADNILCAYNQICDAYLELKRGDIAEFIRREQVLRLTESLHKLQQKKQQDKIHFNEQIRLAKEDARHLREELETSKETHDALVTDRLSTLKAAAQPAIEESSKDSRSRAVRVIALLHQYQNAAMWKNVSHQILTNGKLDLERAINNEQVQDLTYLVGSGAADNITCLNVNHCHLAREEFAKLLTAVGSLKQLKKLRLRDNDLRGRPQTTLTATIGDVRGLETLDIGYCHLSDEDVAKLLSVISTLTTLKVLWLDGNSISDDLAGRVAETVVNISSLTQLYLVNNCLTQAGITKVRHVMRESPSVWLVGLDWQRPAGQELDHPDPVVTVQLSVDNIQRAQFQLQERLLTDRDKWWNKDVAWLQTYLDACKDALSRAKAKRDGQH